jgi:hypothetical protein
MNPLHLHLHDHRISSLPFDLHTTKSSKESSETFLCVLRLEASCGLLLVVHATEKKTPKTRMRSRFLFFIFFFVNRTEISKVLRTASNINKKRRADKEVGRVTSSRRWSCGWRHCFALPSPSLHGIFDSDSHLQLLFFPSPPNNEKKNSKNSSFSQCKSRAL